MQSPTSFIVQPVKGRRYDNIKEIGGINFITSVSKEDHKASNRFATVVSTPLNYNGDITAGDILLVHHNVFKFYFDLDSAKPLGVLFFTISFPSIICFSSSIRVNISNASI